MDVSGSSTDNHLLTGLQNGDRYTISIVGTSEHLPSDRVDYSNSITLSKLLQVPLAYPTSGEYQSPQVQLLLLASRVSL